MVIFFFQFKLANGNSVTIERYDTKRILVNLEQLPSHYFITFIICNRENGLSDDLF